MRGGEARVKKTAIICIYFKYPHPHNQKMHFIRETILQHQGGRGGRFVILLLDIVRRQPPNTALHFPRIFSERERK